MDTITGGHEPIPEDPRGSITYVDRRPISALILDAIDGRIRTIYIVTSPEKLARLPTPSEFPQS